MILLPNDLARVCPKARKNKNWVVVIVFLISSNCIIIRVQHLRNTLHISATLFRKKSWFELNFLFLRNASKFAIIIEKENPCSFFLFFISSNFEFYLTNSQTYFNFSEEWQAKYREWCARAD